MTISLQANSLWSHLSRSPSTGRRFFRQMTVNRWTDQTMEMGVDPAMLAVLSLAMAEGKVQPWTLSLDGEPP